MLGGVGRAHAVAVRGRVAAGRGGHAELRSVAETRLANPEACVVEDTEGARCALLEGRGCCSGLEEASLGNAQLLWD